MVNIYHMKKLFLLSIALVFISLNIMAKNQQIIVGKNYVNPNEAILVAEKSVSTTIKFDLNELNLNEVRTNYGLANKVMSANAPVMAEEGSPELIYLPAAIIIPDIGSAELMITYGEYIELENIEIAPSKGNLPRSIDPETIPYRKGEVYNNDAFFPGTLATLSEPFIMRDVRGQTIFAYPVQYNPVTKILRIYSELTVQVNYTENEGVNEFTNQKRSRTVDPTFSNMYKNLFLNHAELQGRSWPTEEEGELLIISHPAFMDDMKPYIDWKRTSGRKTTMVSTATTGTTAAQIKSYISNYYNVPENNLAYVLLVGGSSQIPAHGTISVPSDNIYGQLVGTDPYMEVLIGRISAENVAHVQTQVQRTIQYERDLTTADTWLSAAIGLARNEGPGHDGGEYDHQHMNNIRTRLLAYGYQTVYQEYTGVSGMSNTTAAQVSKRFNDGVGIANYCNHGLENSWNFGITYSNTHVNQLLNAGKLPFIYSVACLNGKFTQSSPCFAETWMRASQNNQPTGAVAAFMATISIAWLPPMTAQDEFVNICMDLPSPYGQSAGIKRTFAGAAINSTQKMLIRHGTDSRNVSDFNSWTIFGDPTLMIRTKTPQQMLISHQPVIFFEDNEFSVNCDVEGALATMSYIDENNEVVILSTAIVENGIAHMIFDEAIAQPNPLTLCIVAKDRVTYIKEILPTSIDGPYIIPDSYEVVGADMLTYTSVNREITVTLRNVGIEATEPATVTIFCNDPQLIITSATAQSESIDVDGTTTVSFRVTVANNIPNNKVFPLIVTVEEDSRTRSWEGSLLLKAYAPDFLLEKVLINGIEGGILEPDAVAIITAIVKNTGDADAYNVIGNLETNSEYITFACESLNSVPQPLPVGETIELPFVVIVSSTTPFSHTANLNLALSAQYGRSFAAPFTASSSDGYCIPGSTNCGTFGDRLTFVELVKTSDSTVLISHEPICSSNGYTNYTNMEIMLIPGQQYTIKVKTDYANHRVRGWFDLNGNGSFDTGEDLINITCTLLDTEYSQTFTIPENAIPGVHRFRLRTRDQNTAPAACSPYNYGQTLDYSIVIAETYPRVRNVNAALASATSILITWDAPVGEMPVGYNVYRNGNCLNAIPLTDRSFTDGNISEGVYVYNVTAIFAGNKESAPQMSNIVCNSISPILCEKPINLIVVADNNCNILITWEEPERDGVILSYNVYRDGNKIIEIPFSVLEYFDEALFTGTYVYSVSATYAHCGETDLIDGVEVTIDCLGINNIQTASFEIFPNPASGKVIIKGTGLSRVELFDLQGRKLAGYNNIKDNLQINVSNYESGTYFVKMYSENNQTVTKRLIIVK